MSSPAAISCSALTRRYVSGVRRRSTVAVDAVDLDIPSGAAFALVGPNGAGKTTLMLMAIGLMRPTSGTALIDGTPADRPGARTGLGFVPEKFQLPRYLTGREFLDLHAALGGLTRDDARKRVAEVSERVQLSDRIDERVSVYSKGMQQRIAIAQALLARPRLLVLDEPTSALDPLQRRLLRDTLRAVHADGCTIVLNSHNLAEVEDICDHVAILQDGKIVARGAVRELVRGATRVTVRVGNWSDTVRTALEQHTELADLHVGDDDRATFTCAADTDADIARIAATIVGASGELLELTPHSEGLEELFVRTVTGGDDAEGVSA
jgi:ABC-2 type transport system ATP-binding protein